MGEGDGRQVPEKLSSLDVGLPRGLLLAESHVVGHGGPCAAKDTPTTRPQNDAACLPAGLPGVRGTTLSERWVLEGITSRTLEARCPSDLNLDDWSVPGTGAGCCRT